MTILPQPPAIVAGAESSPTPAAFRSAITVRVAAYPLPCPERLADLESLGYSLGLDRVDASAPEGSTAAEAAAFDRGWAAGLAEWNRRLDIMCGSADYPAAFSDYDAWPNGGMS